jgi:hypothetical protein
MKIWLHKYDTKEDGVFYRISESNHKGDETEYFKKYYTYGDEKELPQLVWSREFEEDSEAKAFAKIYLEKVEKYKPLGVPKIKTAAKTFKGSPPDSTSISIEPDGGEHHLALISVGGSFYAQQHTSSGKITFPGSIKAEDIVWNKSIASLTNLKNLRYFIHNKCSSLRKRPGNGNSEYHGYGEIFKPCVDNLSFENLKELFLSGVIPNEVKAPVEKADW